jgi:outer membrane protein assembly factor BamA
MGKFIYLPKIYYSSERGVGFGGQIFRLFRWPDPASPSASDIRLRGRITTKGQGEAELIASIHMGGGRYDVKGKINYNTLALRFYGIGPDTHSDDEEIYEPQSMQAYVEVFRHLNSYLRVGFRSEFNQVALLDVEEGGLLDTENIPGTNDEIILGSGLLVDWDTRNSKFYPTSGSYHQLFYLVFDDAFGSDHDFHNYNVDLRKYFSLGRGQVLAGQFFIFGTDREVPFWRLAALGGRSHTRGYRTARYIDRVLLAFQAEYRLPLTRRVELALFGGMGDVGPKLKSLQLEHMKPTVGAGLRLNTSSNDGVRIRLDAAFGESSARVSYAFDQAF